MQYRVQVTINPVTGASYFGYPIYLQVTIDGTSRVTTTLKAANPSQWSSAIVYTSAWFTVENKTSGTTSVSFRIYSGSGSSRNTTYSYAMIVDPAASILAPVSGTLGQPMQLQLTRYGSDFIDTVTWKAGTQSGIIATLSQDTEFTFVPEISLAAQNTTGEAVQINFTVSTYQANGTELVAQSTRSAVAQIPATVVPTAALAVSDSTQVLDTYGKYVQGQSVLQLEVDAQEAYEAPITVYSITADGKSYNTQSVVAGGPIAGSGTLIASAYVSDARGRKSQTDFQNIEVIPWTRPVISNVTAERANSDGTPNETGDYAKITFDASISPVEQKNTARYSITYQSSARAATTIELTELNDQYVVSQKEVIFEAAAASAFEIQVIAQDAFAQSKAYSSIPIAFRIINAATSGDSIAFGRVSTPGKGFEVDMPATFYQNVTLPEEVIKAIVLAAHPVGSLYWSEDSTDPSEIFGGTWERIKDVFILAAGDTYAAGTTGGEATHTLTVDEIPSHSHSIHTANSTAPSQWNGAHLQRTNTGYYNNEHEGIINNTGGGAAHNNMPPYETYYCWKRIEDAADETTAILGAGENLIVTIDEPID